MTGRIAGIKASNPAAIYGRSVRYIPEDIQIRRANNQERLKEAITPASNPFKKIGFEYRYNPNTDYYSKSVMGDHRTTDRIDQINKNLVDEVNSGRLKPLLEELGTSFFFKDKEASQKTLDWYKKTYGKNIDGLALPDGGIAINPYANSNQGILFHEAAHQILNHPNDLSMHPTLAEFEAESAAQIALNRLNPLEKKRLRMAGNYGNLQDAIKNDVEKESMNPLMKPYEPMDSYLQRPEVQEKIMKTVNLLAPETAQPFKKIIPATYGITLPINTNEPSVLVRELTSKKAESLPPNIDEQYQKMAEEYEGRYGGSLSPSNAGFIQNRFDRQYEAAMEDRLGRYGY